MSGQLSLAVSTLNRVAGEAAEWSEIRDGIGSKYRRVFGLSRPALQNLQSAGYFLAPKADHSWAVSQ